MADICVKLIRIKDAQRVLIRPLTLFDSRLYGSLSSMQRCWDISEVERDTLSVGGWPVQLFFKKPRTNVPGAGFVRFQTQRFLVHVSRPCLGFLIYFRHTDCDHKQASGASEMHKVEMKMNFVKYIVSALIFLPSHYVTLGFTVSGRG